MQFHRKCVVLVCCKSYHPMLGFGIQYLFYFGHSALQSFKCVCGLWTHVVDTRYVHTHDFSKHGYLNARRLWISMLL